MYPYIQIILPSYAFLAFLGVLVTLTFLYLNIDSIGISFSGFLVLSLKCAIGCFIGSKLLYFITQIPNLLSSFSVNSLITAFLHSGYVFYGGLLGVLFTVWLSVRNKPERAQSYFNFLAPAIPLFHFFGRIGCFLTGCCYGKDFAKPVVLFNSIILYQIPVQLIEAVFELCLFFVIYLLQRRRTPHLIYLYLTSYSVFRFIIEFFRGDEVRGIYFNLSTAQWISIFIFGYVLFKFWRLNKSRSVSQT